MVCSNPSLVPRSFMYIDPGVIRARFFTTSSPVCIALDYCSGGTLKDYLGRGEERPGKEKLRLSTQIASAMAYRTFTPRALPTSTSRPPTCFSARPKMVRAMVVFLFPVSLVLVQEVVLMRCSSCSVLLFFFSPTAVKRLSCTLNPIPSPS